MPINIDLMYITVVPIARSFEGEGPGGKYTEPTYTYTVSGFIITYSYKSMTVKCVGKQYNLLRKPYKLTLGIRVLVQVINKLTIK